jgi:hypothetical protein
MKANMPITVKKQSLNSIINAKKIGLENQIKQERKYKTISVKRSSSKFGVQVVIHVLDNNVRNWLQSYTSLEVAYHSVPSLRPTDLIPVMDTIRSHKNSGHEYLKELVKLLDYQFGEIIETCKDLVAKNMISFDALWYIFPDNTEVKFKKDNELCAGIVRSLSVHEGWTGRYVMIKVEQITSDGRTFVLENTEIKIRDFNGTMAISNLPLCPLDVETKEKLAGRGRTFIKYALGTHYVQYKGFLKIDSWYGPRFFRSEGRIMIDTVSHDKRDQMGKCREENQVFDTIPEEKLAFHSPYLKGFSFNLKMWGGFAISDMEEIKFNEKAFDTLVLDEEKKKIISALVRNAKVGFKDIIQGKSGGIIFGLAGSVGAGKTLTAEAIAETMKKPLYSVSIGELGVSPTELETKLREILDIAETWDAVILIDEADIFLEKRTANDIVRNAMVGVFLRLLEYHRGVLFLTTNRIKNYDEAFYSRISVSLNYEPHGKDGLRKIWTNLLEVAGLKNVNIDELIDYEVNGRQIKTAIRLAQALAADTKEPMTIKHIKKTLALRHGCEEQTLKNKGK